MAQWNLRSKRKYTGALYKKQGKKRRQDRGRDFTPTHLGEKKIVKIRARGGNEKLLLLKTTHANVVDGKKTSKVKIHTVAKNTANEHYVRRNIITKGAIIETDLGKARVTSRPGQDGTINAVLIKEAKK